MKVGDSVGNYRVIAGLGRGGHGDVWLAEHTVVGKRVAVKVIAAHRAAREEARERFLVEARAVAQIDHPQVVQLFDFGVTEPGDLYFTMEHLDGRSLRALLDEEKKLPVARALRIAAQIADALAAAHAKGVIHRDLKPDNVFLLAGTRADRVKVLDFGLARRMDQSFTAEGALLGTPAYMSPEQCAARRDLDGRIDVYALGCMLHELLDGNPPFVGSNEEVMRAQRSRLPQRLPSLPGPIQALLTRALQKDREARFPSMAAFADALTNEAGRAAEAVPDVEQPIAFSAKKTLERNPPSRSNAPTVQQAAPRSRRTIWIGLASLVVVVAASPVAVQLWRHAPVSPTVAPPPSPRRKLAVRSVPAGATVVIDGIGYGPTPVEIALEPGAGDLSLSLDGFAPWRGTVDPGREAVVEAQLIPLPPAPKPHVPHAPGEKKPPPKAAPTRLTDEQGLLRPALDE
jgi:serine/threonine-protein kinase